MAWGLSMVDKEDVFQLIESKSTVEKWLHGPKILLPDYKLPSGSAEVETLRKVFSERNRLVHPKSMVQKDGKEKLAGRLFKPTKFSDLLVLIGGYFCLPFDLADFFRLQSPINGDCFPIMAHRGSIEHAPQHKLVRLSVSLSKAPSTEEKIM
ncbi:MAG: hypothetical protein JWQ10_178 [Herbaspirillum sp.]|nr:hypothetical protein [Herbaspirillum sp.]